MKRTANTNNAFEVDYGTAKFVSNEAGGVSAIVSHDFNSILVINTISSEFDSTTEGCADCELLNVGSFPCIDENACTGPNTAGT